MGRYEMLDIVELDELVTDYQFTLFLFLTS